MYEVNFNRISTGKYIINLTDYYITVDINIELTDEELNNLCKKLEDYEQWFQFNENENNEKPLSDEVNDDTIIYSNHEIKMSPTFIKVSNCVNIKYDSNGLFEKMKKLLM